MKRVMKAGTAIMGATFLTACGPSSSDKDMMVEACMEGINTEAFCTCQVDYLADNLDGDDFDFYAETVGKAFDEFKGTNRARLDLYPIAKLNFYTDDTKRLRSLLGPNIDSRKACFGAKSD